MNFNDISTLYIGGIEIGSLSVGNTKIWEKPVPPVVDQDLVFTMSQSGDKYNFTSAQTNNVINTRQQPDDVWIYPYTVFNEYGYKPYHVKSIKDYKSEISAVKKYACYSMLALSSIDLPACTNIETYAFANCSELISANVPYLSSYQPASFYYCPKLEKVYIADDNSYIQQLYDYALLFNQTSYGGNILWASQPIITDISLPEEYEQFFTQIGAYAFSYCANLTSLNLPYLLIINQSGLQNAGIKDLQLNELRILGQSALADCTALSSVVFENLTTIYKEAFKNCTALSTLTIPASVTSISSNAFYGCTSLTSLYFTGKTSLDDLTGMANYPWGITDTSVFKFN